MEKVNKKINLSSSSPVPLPLTSILLNFLWQHSIWSISQTTLILGEGKFLYFCQNIVARIVVASDALYHGLCESIFSQKKCIPTTKWAETEHLAGHPTDNAMKSNFEKLCKWLDEQTELFAVSKVHAKMWSFAEKILNIYCLKWMKQQLEQHYQNSSFLSQIVRRTGPFESSFFYRYGKYHIIRAMVKIKEREF